MARSTGIAVAVALALGSASARADAPAPDSVSPHPVAATGDDESLGKDLVPKRVFGFVLANGSLTHVPTSVARTRTTYQLASVLGLSAAGHPLEKWEYEAFITTNVNTDINGTSGSFAPELIALTYKPIDHVSLRIGYMRIPFSVGQSSVITNSMFPTRPQPTQLFQGGADAGFLAGYDSEGGKLRGRLGVFDGLSLNTVVPDHTTRGPVISVSTEVSPLGEMPRIEGDYKKSDFRFALAAGLVYRVGTAFDRSGYSGLGVDDLGVAFAARMAFKGLYVQGEYLQYRRTDTLSGRPRVTRGTYGEASYHVRVKRMGLSPMARLGWSEGDAGFYPLEIITGNVGFAFFPRGDLDDRGRVRLVLEYQGERRVAEGETGYGALGSVMARF